MSTINYAANDKKLMDNMNFDKILMCNQKSKMIRCSVRLPRRIFEIELCVFSSHMMHANGALQYAYQVEYTN